MTIALIATSPYAIIGTYADGTAQFRLPSSDVLEGAKVGWTGEGCALVAVKAFIAPSGQQIIGAPTYSIDGSGNVTESYATEAIPAIIPSCQLWQLQAAMTSAQWSAAQAAVASLNNPAVTAFFAHGTNTIPANSTTLLTLGKAIGLTADQVTALVLAASEISIP